MTTDALAICVAPNGARKTKADHPALPLTPDELGAEAAACARAGAGVIHLHVRGPSGEHTLDAGRYREAIAEVRLQAPELIVQVTTEAVGVYSADQQMAVVDALKPQAVSLALRELAPGQADEPAFQTFLARTRDYGTGVQYIVYGPDEAARVAELAMQGVLGELEPHALFVLGRYQAGQRSAPRDLLPFVNLWPADWPWSVCAFGPLETQCLAAAMALGGHVRVGFENNLLTAKGRTAASNAERVSDIARIACEIGRPLAQTDQLNRIYRLGDAA